MHHGLAVRHTTALCESLRLYRRWLGGATEIAALSARWAAAQNIPPASVCRCGVYNLRVRGAAV